MVDWSAFSSFTHFRGIDERENRIYVYDTVAAKKTAKLLDWIGKRRLQCSDMVEYKGQTGKIISEAQHDIVIAFDYDGNRKDRVTLPIDVT